MFRFLLSSLLLTFSTISVVLSIKWVQMEPDVVKFGSPAWTAEQIIKGAEPIDAIFVFRHEPKAVELFEKELTKISHPTEPQYGKWMSKSEVREKLAPPDDNFHIVKNYLASQGNTQSNCPYSMKLCSTDCENMAVGVEQESMKLSELKDKLHVKMTAQQASVLLNTKLRWFSWKHGHTKGLARIVAPYFLPEEVATVIELVDGILRFPHFTRTNRPSIISQALRGKELSEDPFRCQDQCQGFTTPFVLQDVYNFKPLRESSPKNSMAVAEFQLQYYDNKDLDEFSTTCSVNATVDETIGGNIDALCLVTGCVEALLDIEYIKAVAAPIPLTVIYSFKYSLLDWIDGVLTMDSPPLVHSLSYGNDEVQQTSESYMFAVNQQLMKAAARGLTIVVASGDQGVWGRTGDDHSGQFHPDFPASSPYVTSVGGTNFVEKSKIGEESAWSCGGGGFSNTFDRPSWQNESVSNYLALAKRSGSLPKTSMFNESGRAYPDVSALGGQLNPYCVSVFGGKFRGVAGTSASAPVIAGIFARLNNKRLKDGKSPLGFINPLLYSKEVEKCFRDVRDGSRNNCKPDTEGFSALDGWDPATGFGSLNVSCLESKI